MGPRERQQTGSERIARRRAGRRLGAWWVTTVFLATAALLPGSAEAATASDLSISKTADPDPAFVGQTITYTITIVNSGPDTMTGVEGLDSLPDEVDFVSASDSAGSTCGHDGTFAFCDIGTMPPGTITMTVVGTVTGMPPNGVLVNFCTVFPDNDQNPDNNHCRVETTVVDGPFLVVEKADSADPVEQGSQLTYTITVRNIGTETAEGVVAVDTLPDKVAFSSGAGCTVAGQQVTCNVGDMPAGSTAFIQIIVTVTPESSGTIENVVTASGSNTNTAQASEPTTIFCIPEAAFTETDVMQNLLGKTIERLEKGKLSRKQLKARTKQLEDMKFDLVEAHFPTVFGIEFEHVFRPLDQFDNRMLGVRILSALGSDEARLAKSLKAAQTQLTLLEAELEAAP